MLIDMLVVKVLYLFSRVVGCRNIVVGWLGDLIVKVLKIKYVVKIVQWWNATILSPMFISYFKNRYNQMKNILQNNFQALNMRSVYLILTILGLWMG